MKSLTRIVLFVSLCHLIPIVLTVRSSAVDMRTHPVKKLAVQTVIIKEPPKPKKVVKQQEPRRTEKPAQETKKSELIAKAKNLWLKQSKNISSSDLSDLKSLETLQIETEETAQNEYSMILANHLRQRLRLPEEGEVKVLLTVNREGKVVNVKILTKKHSSNNAYIEQTLPMIQLPPFGSYFKNEGQHTFTITLTSALQNF